MLRGPVICKTEIAPKFPISDGYQNARFSRKVLVTFRNGSETLLNGTCGTRSPTPLSALATGCRMDTETVPRKVSWNAFETLSKTYRRKAVGMVSDWQGVYPSEMLSPISHR